ncbi:MAG: hypothetical protein BGO12_00195 [Verrucomicrobia bacterium 61-8]|nr:MAG: hypothetical protein BGO12_00195 [Verrucomicrobia bacterium 61-8]
MIHSLNNLYNAALDIRTLLMPFAFVLCVIGIGEMAWRAGSDPRAILGALIKVSLIVGLLVSYPTMMDGGQKAFIEMRTKFTNARDAKFVQLLRSRIENQPSDSWTDLGKIVPAAIGMFFQGIGRFMLLVLRFFQEFAIAGLIAVSPLLIGFLFFSPTQSLGVQFGVTSLTVLLWHVAICLVDIVIVAISDTLFMPITAGGLVQAGTNLIIVQNWLLFPFIMAFAAIITVFFYLSVPFVAGAIMKGVSGTTAALQAGVQGTMQAAGLAVGAGLTAAGAVATMGGSTAVQGALAGAQAVAGTASAAARIAGDVSGSLSGGDVPPPPPVPAGGDSVANPDNPAMVAHQTSPTAFSVVDTNANTVSHHPGSLATPHAAQAAFNSHAAKAQPLESRNS